MVCALLHTRGRRQRSGAICYGPSAASGLLPGREGSAGLLQATACCQPLPTAPEGAAISFPLPCARCRMLFMMLLPEMRGRGGPREAASAFLPLSSARRRRQWGSSTSPTSHPPTVGEHLEQMLFSHQLCHCPPLSIYKVHLLPITALSVGYSHRQL